MPEYKHPGVYIEETSYRGKSIEGVSTSTAGLVGYAVKGPEGRPTLVTSFAQFRREFGDPVPLAGAPNPGEYLGHSVRSFFENGGKRAYIVRTLAASARVAASVWNDAGSLRPAVRTGERWGLAPNGRLDQGNNVLRLQSVRGLRVGQWIRFRILGPSGTWGPGPIPATADAGAREITGVDPVANTITLASGLGVADLWAGATPTDSVVADRVYIVRAAAASPHADAVLTANGPTFRAQYRGRGGNDLSVQFRMADRPPVAVRIAGPAAATVPLESVGSFYTGAIVEVRQGSATQYVTVTAVDLPGRTVTLSAPTGAALTTADSLRVLEFDVLIYEKGALKENFTGLTWNPNPATASIARYYVARINDDSTGSSLVRVITTDNLAQPPAVPPLIVAPQPPAAILDPTGQPTTENLRPVVFLDGDDGGALSAPDLIGTDSGPGRRTGIQALAERDDIALVAVPGVTDRAVQSALLVHCENLRYRFAVLDGINSPDTTALQTHRNAYDSKYGGYYTPWPTALDLGTGRTIVVPPSGHVLGIYARVRHRARRAQGAGQRGGARDAALLAVQQRRAGRAQPGRHQPACASSRAAASGCGAPARPALDSEWKYVNVRRLFIYLEHSIDRGTQWVVFEPNNESLWQARGRDHRLVPVRRVAQRRAAWARPTRRTSCAATAPP
jgi:hypothetical protein